MNGVLTTGFVSDVLSLVGGLVQVDSLQRIVDANIFCLLVRYARRSRTRTPKHGK